MLLWGYVRRGWAKRAWKGWYDWAIRSRLEPIKRVARLIKYYWDGVITAATTNVTNARSEGMNSKIQWIKRMACGYRNRQRFHNRFGARKHLTLARGPRYSVAGTGESWVSLYA